jgi:hypothetical protein
MIKDEIKNKFYQKDQNATVKKQKPEKKNHSGNKPRKKKS